MSELSLIVRRVIRAPSARVFKAWTTPDQLRAWWGPKGVACCEAQVDLRPGGSYRIGNQLPDGKIIWIWGEFNTVEAPTKLIYTWNTDSSQDAERVTVRFEEHHDGCEVIVVHERIATEPLRVGHNAGWQGCLDGLAHFDFGLE
ncbi:MAG: hypothetical protein ACI9MC_003821 [Kiritimatiellia bacterium]|jgi:uncharacterized protein YndB with AHSA1/START domain